jgi:tRNA(fMet)-specific endonuclease VapC
MPRYMLDTDICSFVMKRRHPTLLRRLGELPTEDVCASVVTKAELLYGVAVSPNPVRDGAALDALLRHLAVAELDEDTAAHYADIRADLKRRGELIGANDLFIAAHARRLGLVLVTANVREFSRVERLEIENWTA